MSRDRNTDEWFERHDRLQMEIVAVVLDAVLDHLGINLTPDRYREALLEVARRYTTSVRAEPKHPNAFEEAVQAFIAERRGERERLARRGGQSGQPR